MVLAAGATDPAPLISFSVIMLIAFIAPLFSHLSGNRIPSVVLLIAGGVLIGPHALDWANTDGGVGLLKELGLGMLFLLAGYEIDPAMLKTKQAKHGVSTWLICACVSYIGAVLLLGSMRSLAAVALAIAVTSTAIGTLMPILKSSQLLDTPVGKSVLVHGAIGEVMPIIAMVLLLSARATWLTAVVLFAFVAIAVLIALVPRTVAFLLPWAERAMIDSAGSTNQTIVRGVLVILAVLMAVAAAFQLDVVLGARRESIIFTMRRLASGPRATPYTSTLRPVAAVWELIGHCWL